ncbi:hypothetical protein F4604DRAFT_1929911 [Suillus subluteus]|nr:hypothetical protein F4604DRAFT_1929911 [Suillus subluteus]
MLMRFHFGLGVGHMYSHKRTLQTEPPHGGVAGQDDREVDENYKEAEEDDPPSEEEDGDLRAENVVQPFGSSNESLVSEFDEIISDDEQCPPAGLVELQSELALVAYLSTPMIHSPAYESPETEVPVYVLILRTSPTPFLNLHWIQGKTGYDNVMHGVYDHASVASADEPETVIHLVRHPSGYYVPVPELPAPELVPASELLVPAPKLLIPAPKLPVPAPKLLISAPKLHVPAPKLLVPEVKNSVSGSSILPTTSWVESSVMVSTTRTKTVMLAHPKKVQAEHSLHKVMQTCPNWRKALACLCVLLRIALCLGHSDNPHVLINVDYAKRRLELICSCWPDCLVRANVAPEALEMVLMKDSKAPMTHTEVLTLASPWITQFLYDNRQIVAHYMDDPRIFGLGNFFGLAQRHSIMMLLQMFTRPNTHLLPIEANGFATFLTHQMTKEMVYHIVFRTTTMSCIRLTIADLEPVIFRNAPHPPVDTLALSYQALLARLVNMWGTANIMPDYPTPVQIYAELREAATMLIQAEDDPGIVPFKAELRGLCTIIEMDVYCVGRPNRAGRSNRAGLPPNTIVA